MPETITLDLTDMAAGGDAVGRHDGQVVFVPLGLPGERVTVDIQPSTASFTRGVLRGIERPSPARVTPLCPVFAQCGGCQWQHVEYGEQLRLKEGILTAALERIGHLQSPAVLPMLGMEDPWRYRNHVQLRVGRDGRPGYYALQSHDIVPTDTCLIAHPSLMTMWDVPRRFRLRADEMTLRAGVNTGDRLAHLRGRDRLDERARVSAAYSVLYTAGGRTQVLSGRESLQEKVSGQELRISARAFFQNNTLQTERLVAAAADMLQLQPGESLLDTYCGGGLLGLLLAGPKNTLLGIESVASSLRDARMNAGERATYLEGDVADVLGGLDRRFDAIVLDPPRVGCTESAVEAMSACGASRIVYVSCDPATLARDLARFAARGYAVDRVQPVDMFPQTYHIECVALLSRVSE